MTPLDLVAEFSSQGAYTKKPRTRPWTELRIYRLANGYLCEKHRHLPGTGAPNCSRREVTTLGQARDFFGKGWVVRELFEDLRFRSRPRLVASRPDDGGPETPARDRRT